MRSLPLCFNNQAAHDLILQLPLERNPVRSRLRPLLAQAELNLPPLDEPARQVPPTASDREMSLERIS
jgi:hypothetical protein